MSSPPTHSIIEFFDTPPEGHRCGYCKSPDTNFSYGMWAHTITPENYENLINVGWRRSGSYIYKPINDKVCCPMYTIRNLSTSVEISRSQRKVLKRFKRYVTSGVKPTVNEPTNMESEPEPKSNPKCTPKPDTEQLILESKIVQPEPKPHPKPPEQQHQEPVKKKPHPLKKKFLRREKKRQKLIAKGLDPEEFFKRNDRNRVAELDSFFQHEQSHALHFTTKLVKVDSGEFEEYFKLEHKLYQKYQMHTHGDTEHECRASQFRRFLCDNPFKTEDDPPLPQGTYHQHYYIDSTLIAVGVIDILPHCVSSVYFFYDPDHSFLSPGTLGALHEISFVNHLNRTSPELKYYYLGFYIHDCIKMRYKRKFRPCELVCPVTNEWVRFDERVLKLLDTQKYAKLKENGTDRVAKQDIESVLILYNRTVYSYSTYPQRQRDAEPLQLYVNLVGSRVASNMLLFRSARS